MEKILGDQRLTAIRGKTRPFVASPQEKFDPGDQRLTAIRGKTRQLPKPNHSKCPETILQAPPTKWQLMKKKA